VQVDALAVRLRPRRPLEASDLGVRLCQEAAPSVFRCFACVAAPVMIVALASYEVANWLPSFVIFLAKPWLDRTILFALSRAAFGQTTAPRDLWRARREVLFSQLLRTWTLQRLSPWRALTQPVYQLEGTTGQNRSTRVRQIRSRTAGSATMATVAFLAAETALTATLTSLALWLVPTEGGFSFLAGAEQLTTTTVSIACAYSAAVFFVEPFFVASGFAMYLNRRAELEAWDIEQEFKRAFAR
jgi:hypothetical protein